MEPLYTLTPARTLRPGDHVAAADGFLMVVVSVTPTGRSVLVGLRPEFGVITWPSDEVRTQKIGANRMVRVYPPSDARP